MYPSTEDIAGQDGRNGDGLGDGQGEDLRATARTLRCGGRARDDGERRKAQSIIFVGHFFFKFSLNFPTFNPSQSSFIPFPR